MKHEYTVEVLYHFTCSRCQQWWSWASTPRTNLTNVPLSLPENEFVFCPHCGFKNTLKIKDGFIEEKT
jgi:DNA-directed RNA polymerase subunit RPC12/RpoP